MYYKSYTIDEVSDRNPYAKRGSTEIMFYPTEEGIQHDADCDGDGFFYCGNCEWAYSQDEAMDRIDEIEAEKEIRKAQKDANLIWDAVTSGFINPNQL
jgi:hypothetical protein